MVILASRTKIPNVIGNLSKDNLGHIYSFLKISV